MTDNNLTGSSGRTAAELPGSTRPRSVTLRAEPVGASGPPATTGVDARAISIGRMQQGVCTRRQLREVGISTRSIHRRITTGVWQERPGGVVVLGTNERTWEQGLAAALLAAGADQCRAWASHLTAGYLHRLLDVAGPRRLDVTVPRDRRPRSPSATVHRVRSIPIEDRVVLDGLPATSLARTLLDLGWIVVEVRHEDLSGGRLRELRTELRRFVIQG